MHQIVPKERCCGCGACLNACKHHAILMQFDDEGFEYPIINLDKCADCGLCYKVCPVINYNYESSINNCNAQKAYVARNNQYDQRLQSSSGSIFPPIAEWIIDRGGIVVGTAYDESFNAVPLIINKRSDIVKLQGSKYLQCKADNIIFNTIQKELQNGKLVLYAGLACQVEGLKSFLGKDYENLYTIDLICMGIPSPVVWQKYLETFFPHEIIRSVNFKEKSIGWDTFCVLIETNQRVFKERGMNNLYLQSMFHTYNMRPSCFNCPFKKVERKSDFTIADAWGMSQLASNLNDNKGLSSVIVHSHKGLLLWQELKERIEFEEIQLSDIVKGNSNLVKCKQPADDRVLFYKVLSLNPKNAFIQMCSANKPSFIKRIVAVFSRKLLHV